MYVHHSSFASLHGTINQAIKNTPIQVQCGFNGLVMILPESVLSVSTYSIPYRNDNHVTRQNNLVTTNWTL